MGSFLHVFQFRCFPNSSPKITLGARRVIYVAYCIKFRFIGSKILLACHDLIPFLFVVGLIDEITLLDQYNCAV
jgi:hypothetical protein